MNLRLSPFRPWQPMSDREWQVLSGFVLRDAAGRPPSAHRARLDGIFLAATADIPWGDMSDAYGAPDTLRRQFHRWATRGLFDTLLHAALDPIAPEARVLRGMEHWLCCAYRRAIPLAGETMAELLGYGSALRGPEQRGKPSELSALIRSLLNLRETPQPAPLHLTLASLPAFRLTSPERAPIRAPLPNTGRGRQPAPGHDHALGALAACTAPP